MRLIDADDINALLKNMVEKETGAFTKGYNKALRDIKSMVNNSEQCHTAYDISRVVEELDCDRCENCSFLEVCAGSKCCTRCHEKIIEIVKQGGVSDDVCEWKYNDAEYYWESSCENLHIFMADGPKENKYEYCPYCGKKIKAVE